MTGNNESAVVDEYLGSTGGILMIDKNWRKKFRNITLEEGKAYWEEGAISQLDIQGDRISALVGGTWNYRVNILMKDGLPKTMFCGCMDAADGNHCKHMAAVLLAAEEKERPVSHLDVSSYIRDLSRDELMNLVLDLAKDEYTANRIVFRYSARSPEAQLKKVSRMMDEFFEPYRDHSFLNAIESCVFQRNVCSLLEDTAEELWNRKGYEEAFRLSTDVFLRLNDVIYDDFSDIESIMDSCMDIWKKMIRLPGTDGKNLVKSWLKARMNDDSIREILYETMEDFLDEELTTPDDWREELKEIDRTLELFEKEHGKAPVSETFLHRPKVRKRIGLMEELGADEAEVDAWCHEHWQFADVRDICMNKAENRGDKKKVISILEESRKLDAANPLLVKEYSDRLLKLYEESGDRKKVADELLDRFHHESHEEQRNIYHRIRKLLSKEEWPVYRDKMLPSFEYRSEQLGLLSAERDKTALYEMIFKNPAHSGMPDLYEIGAYARMLKKDYAEEIFQAYIDHAEADVLTAKKRADYEDLICQLEHISHFTGGKEAARKLAEKWLVTYPRKRLLEEKLLEFLGKYKGK